MRCARVPIILGDGIGDALLKIGRVPIQIMGKIGFRFSIFYATKEHPAGKILEPFLRNIRYCEFNERAPNGFEKWFFSKMISLSLRTTKIWHPPFDTSQKNYNKRAPQRILLHTHLDGHHGWKGATAKIWPIANWVELCKKLHCEGWEISLLEWDADAFRELKSSCPFLLDGRKSGFLETVQSFLDYDFLFSIDSWSKYVAVWFDLKQVVAISDLSNGYCGFESISPTQVAKWWFHGIFNQPKVKVLGLEKNGSSYSYTYSKLSEMTVQNAIDAISQVAEG